MSQLNENLKRDFNVNYSAEDLEEFADRLRGFELDCFFFLGQTRFNVGDESLRGPLV